MFPLNVNLNLDIKSKSALVLWAVVGLFVSFLIGVHFEFKYSFTKKIPIYDSYYLGVEEVETANKYLINAKTAISEWKVYHADVKQLDSKERATNEGDRARNGLKDINFSILTVAWQLNVRYYLAYLNLICADIKGSIDCLDSMGSELSEFDKLTVSTDLTSEEKKWLENNPLVENAKLLNVQYKALVYKRNPSIQKALIEAQAALYKYGNEQFLKKKLIPQDRLLGEIFRLTFGSVDRVKNQVPE